MPRLVADEEGGEPVLGQGLAEEIDDLGRGVVHALEDRRYAGVDAVGAREAVGYGVAGQPEQVVAFVHAETQTASDGGEYPLRGAGPALLLDTGVVVGRHVGQGGHFLAAQAAGAPAAGARQSDVLGPQRPASGAEEGREFRRVHDSAPVTSAGEV